MDDKAPPNKAQAAHRAIRARVRSLIGAWRAGHGDGWDAVTALRLHEEVEQIAADAEESGADAFAAPALELAVYLCSFAEGASPTESQRAALAAMLAQLHNAAGGPAPPPDAQAKAARGPVVVWLRDAARDIAGLALQLGQHGYVVRPCTDPAQALDCIAHQAVDALLVDSGYLDALPVLLAALEKTRVETAAARIAIVVGQQVDIAQRRYALRAGADDVLETADPIGIAARIDEQFARRRGLDYRVLVVEDDRAQALYAEAILRHRGIATRSVSQAASVLAAMAQFRPDLVLLDLYLPDGNGIEVAQLVREHNEYAFVPIVFLSGEQDLDRRFDAIRMGGDDFVVKPVRPRHLVSTVEARIRLARERARRGATSEGGERRGALAGRERFTEALERAAVETDAGASALVLIGAADDVRLWSRAGFVGSGAFTQQLGAALSSASDLLRPVCAFEGTQFLALAHAESDAALRERLAQFHGRLEGRRWAGAGDGHEVELQLAAFRIRAGADAEAAIARVREIFSLSLAERAGRFAYDSARIAGPVDDPRHQIGRALVQGSLPAAAVQLALLPLQPLAGTVPGQAVLRLDLRAPGTTHPMSLARAEYLAVARALGTVGRSEREQLKHAFRGLAPWLRDDAEARVHVDIAPESLLDPAFAPWLAAELRATAIAPAQLVCVVAADELACTAGDARAAFDRLQIAGVRPCLGAVVGSPEDLKLLSLRGVDAVRVDASDVPAARIDEPRRRAIEAALVHGKVVILAGPVGVHEGSELLKLHVHYVLSEALAPWAEVPYPTPEVARR